MLRSGTIGEKGQKGDRGEKGSKGDLGLVGPKGEPGLGTRLSSVSGGPNVNNHEKSICDWSCDQVHRIYSHVFWFGFQGEKGSKVRTDAEDHNLLNKDKRFTSVDQIQLLPKIELI